MASDVLAELVIVAPHNMWVINIHKKINKIGHNPTPKEFFIPNADTWHICNIVGDLILITNWNKMQPEDIIFNKHER